MSGKTYFTAVIPAQAVIQEVQVAASVGKLAFAGMTRKKVLQFEETKPERLFNIHKRYIKKQDLVTADFWCVAGAAVSIC